MFRGKRVDDGKWVYGYYVFDNQISFKAFILDLNHLHKIEVDPKTVGQATGFSLPDKNGKTSMVFDGDIVEFDRIEWGSARDVFFLVEWDAKEGAWSFGGGSTVGDMEFRTLVGNKFDNPELLKS